MTNNQLQIKRFVFGPFQTNTYVITINDKMVNEQMVLLVDPACYTPYERHELEEYINHKFARLCRSTEIINHKLSIVATHGHLDHLWGAKWATETWQTPVLIHEADIPMVKAMQQQYNLFGIRATAEPFPMEPITNDHLPMTYVSILSTPGHTPGSICLYFPQSSITKNEVNRALAAENNQSSILLSGDTLFQMGFGRTDLPGGNMNQLIRSLDRLFELPPDTIVYPGHGESTTIADEKR